MEQVLVEKSQVPNAASSQQPKNNENNKVKVLGIDISHLSQTAQFIICCIAVFFFYLIYGYMQELIFTLDGFKPFGWYLTLVQFAYYSVFGWCEMRLKQDSTRRIPLKTYLLLALLTLGTMGLSNSSLGHLNYPTQVIFKCCKLIPVMVGSVLLQGKRYGPIDVAAAVFMCIGLALFTLADSQVSPQFNMLGVMMICSALLCDAVIGNVQEKSMKNHQASNTEVVLYSYFIGFIYLFIVMLFTGNLQHGISFCAKHPRETYGYALLFSISGYLGIQVVLTLVRTCGALAAATVTTARKAVTIALSFLAFTKPFTIQYVWSGGLVVLGIYLNIYSKNHKNFGMKDLYALLRNLKYKVLPSSKKFISTV